MQSLISNVVKKCFAEAGFGESDVADNLEEVSENIAARKRTFL
jgi:hypothetical protein